jgi:hypothetical protein
MGFRKICISGFHRNIGHRHGEIEILTAGKVEALIRLLFG